MQHFFKKKLLKNNGAPLSCQPCFAIPLTHLSRRLSFVKRTLRCERSKSCSASDIGSGCYGFRFAPATSDVVKKPRPRVQALRIPRAKHQHAQTSTKKPHAAAYRPQPQLKSPLGSRLHKTSTTNQPTRICGLRIPRGSTRSASAARRRRLAAARALRRAYCRSQRAATLAALPPPT